MPGGRAAELLAGFDARGGVGVGVGSQMHGLVALDETDAVLRPAILWNDGRTAEETAWLNDTVGHPVLSARTGNIAFAALASTQASLDAEKSTSRSCCARIGKIMLRKDYLVYCLTVMLAEFTPASGMLLLDVTHKCWSRDMLAMCAAFRKARCRACTKALHPSACIPETAAALGLPQGVTVCAGAGDNAAAAVGTGTVSTGAAHADSQLQCLLWALQAPFLFPRKSLAWTPPTACTLLPMRTAAGI